MIFNDSEGEEKDRTRKLQLARAGSLQFGIFADEIATIADWREPTPLPHAPKSVLGVVSIQGRMLTVLDLPTLFDSRPARNRSPQHLLALRGDEQLAVAVDALDEAIDVSQADFADGRESDGGLIPGVFKQGGVETNILNVKELFPSAIQGRERRRRRF